MELSLAIAQGFHNAPRLYGDTTVRTAIRITGFHSGLRAAGEEFTLGIYDGVTGLVLQPYNGAKEHGMLGFVQGLGKGIGGFVLKDLAAIFGPVGYTLKGVHKEMVKNQQPTAFIRCSRVIQGRQDLEALNEQQRQGDEQKVDKAWRVLLQLKKEEDIVRSSRLIGRIKVKRVKRKMVLQGAFESVDCAKKAVEDRKMTRSIAENKGFHADTGKKCTKSPGHGKDKPKCLKKNKPVKFNGDKTSGREKENLNSAAGGVKNSPQADGNVGEVQRNGNLEHSRFIPTMAGQIPCGLCTTNETDTRRPSLTDASVMDLRTDAQ